MTAFHAPAISSPRLHRGLVTLAARGESRAALRAGLFRHGLLVAAAAIVWGTALWGAPVQGTEGETPAAGVEDRRSQVIAELDCGSEVARQELTLFANGTIRLWEHDERGDRMRLGELTLAELEALRSRLLDIDFSETDRDALGATGDWVVSCSLELDLEAGGRFQFSYGQFDSLSLALATAVREIKTLEGRVETAVPGSALPPRYEPRSGDILERWDGLRFEVIGPTILGEGVELSGVEVPLTIYMPIADLPRFFVQLESRR